jgi:hypothetical protein
VCSRHTLGFAAGGRGREAGPGGAEDHQLRDSADGNRGPEERTITNVSGSDLLLLVQDGLPDDFGFGLLPGSTCPAFTPGDILAAGASCDVVVRFTPSESFAGLRQTGTLTATLRDPATGELLSTISITVVGRGSTR